MTSEQSLQLFDVVNRNFKNESDARIFVSQIENIIKEQARDEAKFSTSKDDFNVGMATIRKEINDSKLDLIKWMFGFWVTLVMLILTAFILKK